MTKDDATPEGRPGLRVEGSAEELLAAMEAIVDYRGDVTVTRRSGPPIVGYVYDCTRRDEASRATVRLLPADGGRRVAVPLADVAAIELTGRDTAAGKSFETWVRKYVERMHRG